MKIKVIIVDGIIDSVRADAEAVNADVEVEIVDFDKNSGDAELLDDEFNTAGMEPILYEVKHCEPLVITDSDELEDYILEEYNKESVELSSLFFDVQVCMPKRDILEAYQSIQHLINGDYVGRFDAVKDMDGNIIDWEERDTFIEDGEFEDIYEGNCKDFLNSFNGKEAETGFCRFDNEELLDFIW